MRTTHGTIRDRSSLVERIAIGEHDDEFGLKRLCKDETIDYVLLERYSQSCRQRNRDSKMLANHDDCSRFDDVLEVDWPLQIVTPLPHLFQASDDIPHGGCLTSIGQSGEKHV